MSTCILRGCHKPAFAAFDQCVNHVSREALVCEVARLRWKMADAAERPRHENTERNETTILERM